MTIKLIVQYLLLWVHCHGNAVYNWALSMNKFSLEVEGVEGYSLCHGNAVHNWGLTMNKFSLKIEGVEGYICP